MGLKGNVSIKTTVYSGFRGADFSTDPSLVANSRSPLCTNIMPDSGGMPEKRPGWRVLCSGDGRVNGLFYLRTESGTKLLAHIGTALYTFTEDGDMTELMTGLPDHKSRSAWLKGRLWIVTGGMFITTDGTTAERVTEGECYIPTTVITRYPEGGGSVYESVNLLTRYRKNAFQTDGTAVTFTLDGSVDETGEVKAWVWGEETTAFTVDRENGTVTFQTAPAAPEAGSADGLVIQFPHSVEGYAARIEDCTIITTYGVRNNDRIVVSGNKAYQSLDWTSDYNDPTYFPDLGYQQAGSEQTAIRGYCRVGSQLAVIKEDHGQEPTVFLRSASLDDQGKAIFTTVQALNGVGGIAPGSFGTLLDEPLFLSGTGIMAITSNSYTSEKIAQNRSFFVNAQMNIEDGRYDAEAVTWNGMFLLSLPNGHVYIMDAKQSKTYRSAALGDFEYECYYWENVPARTWLRVRDEADEWLYFGTEDGRVCKLNSDMTSVTRFMDDTEPVKAVWATKYDDDGSPGRLKTMIKQGCCVTIKPYARSSGTVYFRSDKTEGVEKEAASKLMDIMDFTDIDFERFTFNTDASPQEIFLRKRVKNYKRLQLIIRNEEPNEGFGVYQITKNFVYSNYGKR